MNYDHNEIEHVVNKKRKKFIICFSVIFIFMIFALVAILCKFNDTLTFLSIIAEFIFALLLWRLFDKISPKILFSKQIKGINIKEDEYVSRKASGPQLRWRQVGGPVTPQPFAPNTRENRKVSPPNIRSKVYLQLENGNIVVLSGLYKSHAEIYVEGDVLLKFAGTHYPIVVGRKTDRNPCPICGEVNSSSQDACHSCGLAIIKE